MFLFECCKPDNPTGVGYQLKKQNEFGQQVTVFAPKVEDFDEKDRSSPNSQITKIKKSEFQHVLEKTKKDKHKFQDPTFPPNHQSLGQIPGSADIHWKRIPEIIKRPVLFVDGIEPKDVVQGSTGECYFLSAIAALAENPENINNIFQNQSYNQEGIYKVTLKVNGEVEEIVIDDYIPVNASGLPVFVQPNKSEFWVLIVEKAYAKAKGSYAAMLSGNPSDVFQAITYATSQSFQIQDTFDSKETAWRLIHHSVTEKHPICATAKEHLPKNSVIHPGHTYTIVGAANLQDSQGNFHKVVRLRNPWENVNWQGASNEHDQAFWNKIEESEETQNIHRELRSGTAGVFIMNFADFTTYFQEIHNSVYNRNGKYISEELKINKKNGTLYELNIEKRSTYDFELHQSDIPLLTREEREDEGACRSTILIIKVNHQNGKEVYDFVNGTLRNHDYKAVLSEQLDIGKYLIFAKIDGSRKTNLVPQKCILSINSNELVHLQIVDQKKYPNLLKNVFLRHSEHGNKKTYSNNLMWISTKLLYKQGGYAYVAFGNDIKNDKAFVVTFNEKDFNDMHFLLKKDFKRKGDGQILRVDPGQQTIILARVSKDSERGLKFPPPIDVKIEEYH